MERLKDTIFEKYMCELGYKKHDTKNPTVVYLFYKKDSIICISVVGNTVLLTGENDNNPDACTCCCIEDTFKIYHSILFMNGSIQIADEYLKERNLKVEEIS